MVLYRRGRKNAISLIHGEIFFSVVIIEALAIKLVGYHRSIILTFDHFATIQAKKQKKIKHVCISIKLGIISETSPNLIVLVTKP